LQQSIENSKDKVCQAALTVMNSSDFNGLGQTTNLGVRSSYRCGRATVLFQGTPAHDPKKWEPVFG